MIYVAAVAVVYLTVLLAVFVFGSVFAKFGIPSFFIGVFTGKVQARRELEVHRQKVKHDEQHLNKLIRRLQNEKDRQAKRRHEEKSIQPPCGEGTGSVEGDV